MRAYIFGRFAEMSHQEHVSYFPKRREHSDAENDAGSHSQRVRDQSQRPDSTFRGSETGYEQSIHGSFDYKLNGESHTEQSKFKQSQTTKHVPVYVGSVPDHPGHVHRNQVEPADYLQMQSIDEQQFMDDAVAGTSNRKILHSQHHHDPEHFGGKAQHHTVLHIDDPNARAVLAHSHAIDVHAPTALHAADDGICSPRCTVGVIGLVCVLGIIALISYFAGVY